MLSSSPSSKFPALPKNPDWYPIYSSTSKNDPTPAEFEPVSAPKSFKIPVDADGNPKEPSDISEKEITSHDDSSETAALKQLEFWEWHCRYTFRRQRWRSRFGNPHTRLGRVQTAFESYIKSGNDERINENLPEWTENSRLAQLIVFYPPILERLVIFLDLQTLLGLMGSSKFLRRWLLNYPPAWRHISLDVRKIGFQKECKAAINEDAQHGSKYGAWTGSRLRHTYGTMRLSGSTPMSTAEAVVLSSLPLVGLRCLNLDGSPAVGGKAFNDVLKITRNTLEVLSVRFCHFIGILDVERLLVSCTVKEEEHDEVEDEEEEEDIFDQEEMVDNRTEYRYVKLPGCALMKLRIWGIMGENRTYHHVSTARKIQSLVDPNTTLKTGLPVEINRGYMAREIKFGTAVAVDQHGSFINGMFYIPDSIGGNPGYPRSRYPASWDIIGRSLVIARQLGIETDFEDCDASEDCWNHKYIKTGNEWKVGVPGLRTVRNCSKCGFKKKDTMCRDCEEHRTCFGCKKIVCRGCDPEFRFVGNQCDTCSDEGRLYCRDCHDATTEALSELTAAKSSHGEHTRIESCPGGFGWHGRRMLEVITFSHPYPTITVTNIENLVTTSSLAAGKRYLEPCEADDKSSTKNTKHLPDTCHQ